MSVGIAALLSSNISSSEFLAPSIFIIKLQIMQISEVKGFSFTVWLIVSALLIVVASKSVQEEKVEQALLSIPKLHDNNFTFRLGDHLTIEYEGRYGQLDGIVLERDQPIDGDLTKDYKEHPEKYRPTQICKMKIADFTLQTSVAKELDKKVIRFAVSQQAGVLYLLTDQLRLLAVHYNQSQQTFSNETRDLGLVPNATTNSLLFIDEKTHTLFISTEKDLLVANFKSAFEVEFSQVQGYVDQIQPNKYKIFGDLLLLIHTKFLSIYKFISNDQIQFKAKVSTFQAKQLFISDAYSRGRKLWLLDQIQGIFYYEFDDRNFRQIQSYTIPYGRKLSMAVQANTFQVVFQFNKQNYVAEMFLQSQSLHLNRFYERVSGVHQVVMIEEILFIMGEMELMATWHSINQYYLLSRKWNNNKFVGSRGVMSIIPLSNMGNTGTLISISHNFLKFYKVVKTLPKIDCDLREHKGKNNELLLGRHSMMIEINTTSCKLGVQQSNLNSYCQTTHDFNFNIIPGPAKKKDFILAGIFFAISLSCIIILICLYLRYHRKKKDQIRQMRNILKRKMDEYEKTSSPQKQNTGESGSYVQPPGQSPRT